jgi:hypothetical protein
VCALCVSPPKSWVSVNRRALQCRPRGRLVQSNAQGRVDRLHQTESARAPTQRASSAATGPPYHRRRLLLLLLLLLPTPTLLHLLHHHSPPRPQHHSPPHPRRSRWQLLPPLQLLLRTRGAAKKCSPARSQRTGKITVAARGASVTRARAPGLPGRRAYRIRNHGIGSRRTPCPAGTDDSHTLARTACAGHAAAPRHLVPPRHNVSLCSCFFEVCPLPYRLSNNNNKQQRARACRRRNTSSSLAQN